LIVHGASPGRIRVLIVDDSVVVRRLVGEVLSADPELEVVGAAATGRIALAKIPQARPDVVTLDVEMPEMDGLETLAQIRRHHPGATVIMFSTLTERGAAATLDALAMGAADYVSKSWKPGSFRDAVERIREELIPKIKTLGRGPEARQHAAAALAAGTPPRGAARARARPGRVDLVAIGASTGGPVALSRLLPCFPPDFPVPLVIVQHMPSIFTRLFAERLAALSSLPVAEAVSGAPLRPGQAWLAPGDFHLVLERRGETVFTRTHQAPPENYCRPSVDSLFLSAARVYGSAALAVVLTGMGQDGLRGCESIHAAAGQVLVQDAASSVVWGMPGMVARAGLAERIVHLDDLANEILGRVRTGRSAQSPVVT
jgi:two-component system chemotaxis response regulator CheB